jgi:hypothetical protein
MLPRPLNLTQHGHGVRLGVHDHAHAQEGGLMSCVQPPSYPARWRPPARSRIDTLSMHVEMDALR